jgi:hypothetical protein
VHKVVVKGVPVDAFWSISVYNAHGYYEKNTLNAYTINSITGKKGADGSTTVQFGGCDGKIPNCIPIVEGWNYTVRLYRPRARDSQRHVQVSRGAARDLRGSLAAMRSGHEKMMAPCA